MPARPPLSRPWSRRRALGALGVCVAHAASTPALSAFGHQSAPAPRPFHDLTIAELQVACAAGRLSAATLTDWCLARIAAYDRQGPGLRAVLTLNPRAREVARQLDAERAARGPRSPLHGMPILLKDNIDTVDLPTTAGSIVLDGWQPAADAFIAARLRDAGAVILGKTNLSEFASSVASSSLGGQMRNPHDLARTPLGSSGGSGIAVASAFCVLAIGTDTGGSIRNPSATTGIAGLKPTYGLVSRRGIVPLALSFDTAGPMARHVADLAVALDVLAGSDAADPVTRDADTRRTAYGGFARDAAALRGARLGVLRDFSGQDPEVDWVLDASLSALRQAGATTVDVRLPSWLLRAKGEFYDAIRYPEFAAQIADYLRATGPAYPKTLREIVARVQALNAGRPDGTGTNPARWTLMRRELAAGPLDDPRYLAVRDHALPLVGAVLQRLVNAERLDALVTATLPTRAPLIVAPAAPPGGAAGSPVNLANLSGWPDLIVPAGMTTDGLPVTLSFLGPAFSEPRLLVLGHAFESLVRARRLPRHTPALPGQMVPLG